LESEALSLINYHFKGGSKGGRGKRKITGGAPGTGVIAHAPHTGE
jgi:hypothetical protein